MAFTMNTLTIKGAELLAAATAQDPLILDGCDACVGYIDQATAVQISARPASPASTSTNTSIIGADGSHVTGRAVFEAGVTVSAEVNTLYLYGHSASDPSSIFVIYISSDENTFHLPASGDVTPVLEILFTMNYASTANSVTVPTTSVYTTLSEFQLLKNRTVTTHAEGQATVGEAQDIYGAKTFKTSISTPVLTATQLGATSINALVAHFDATGQIESISNISDDTSGDDGLYISANCGGGPTIRVAEGTDTNDISLSSNKTTSSKTYNAGMSVSTSSDSGSAPGNASMSVNDGQYLHSIVSAYFIPSNDTAFASMEASYRETEGNPPLMKNAEISTSANSSSSSIELSADTMSVTGQAVFDNDAIFNDGISVETIFECTSGNSVSFPNGLKTDTLAPITTSGTATIITVAGSIVPSSSQTWNVGASNNQFNNVYCLSLKTSSIDASTFETDYVSSNLIPTVGGLSDIGANNARWKDIYANKLHGAIPAPSVSNSALVCEVGTISLIVISWQTPVTSATNIKPGMPLSVGSEPISGYPITSIVVAQWYFNAISPSTATDMDAGAYVWIPLAEMHIAANENMGVCLCVCSGTR